MNKYKILSILYCTILCSLCGCLHYTKGTNTKLSFRRIYIYPVKNDSYAHHITDTLSDQIREKIISCPQLKLVNFPNEADACLEVKITDFDQTTATIMPDDNVCAQSFTLKITAVCSLYNTRTNTYFFKDHRIDASIDSQTKEDYLWNRIKTMPQLSIKLADKIYDIVCNPW